MPWVLCRLDCCIVIGTTTGMSSDFIALHGHGDRQHSTKVGMGMINLIRNISLCL